MEVWKKRESSVKASGWLSERLTILEVHVPLTFDYTDGPDVDVRMQHIVEKRGK